jgi:hypothetical protein
VKYSNLRNVLIFSLCAAGCLQSSCLAKAQEAWGATGAGSTWQAGSAKAATPAVRATVSGAGSHWSAGVGSIPSQRQPSGLWQEGSTSSAAAIKEPAKKLAPGANPLAKPAGFASLSASPGIGHAGTVSNRMQLSKSSTGSHSVNRVSTSVGQHSGVARRGAAGALKQKPGAAANVHRHQLVSQTRNGTKASSPGTSSSMQSDSALKGLSDSASPSDSLGSDSQSSPGDQPQ